MAEVAKIGAGSSAVGTSKEDTKALEKLARENKLKTDIDTLGRDFDPGTSEDRPATSFSTCYNSGCADYRVQRDSRILCECKKQKKPVKGAGQSPGWY